MTSQIKIYQTKEGHTQIDVKFEDETLWLSQKQMADLFDKDIRTINEHIHNIYKENELEQKATIRKFQIVQTEGNRQVKRNIEHYNLDMIISVGYRVNSKKGTQFRIWATSVLRDYLKQGYSIDYKRFEKNARMLDEAVVLINKAAIMKQSDDPMTTGLVNIISQYTQTFLWLQRYDDGLLDVPPEQLGGSLPSVECAQMGLTELRSNLISKGEATPLFAKPTADGISGILGSLNQSIFGEPAYPSIESKAAHLLYFVIKNHPFVDGNKRSAAFLFADFLNRNNRLLNDKGDFVINDSGLAALTLLVAESDPKQKDLMIKLIMNMLSPRIGT
ncbi:virulence RhuM family protein [Thiotrichales bacterium 19X7-9]|nr:virulence RhuM family protein [Thiotrichales bacterium 19X7-9]